MIGIINAGTGNAKSIIEAYKKLNIEATLCYTPDHLKSIKKIILPGVGAFGKFMENLHINKFYEPIKKLTKNGMPILGICVGFQSLFTDCNEFGMTDGLDFIRGNVKKMDQKNTFQIPHIGWNSCKINSNENLFKEIDNNLDFYFCHSYEASNVEDQFILSKTYYGHDIVTSVKKDNILGVQFHPEKSQNNGLKILKNFANLVI